MLTQARLRPPIATAVTVKRVTEPPAKSLVTTQPPPHLRSSLPPPPTSTRALGDQAHRTAASRATSVCSLSRLAVVDTARTPVKASQVMGSLRHTHMAFLNRVQLTSAQARRLVRMDGTHQWRMGRSRDRRSSLTGVVPRHQRMILATGV